MIWVLIAIILQTGEVQGLPFTTKANCEEVHALILKDNPPPPGVVLSQCIAVQA